MEGSSNSGEGNPPPGDPSKGPVTEPFSHQPVAARVPDRCVRGVVSTGVVVLDSPTEFVIDFLQGLTRPFQIVARVVVPPAAMAQLVSAVGENLNRYTQTFGSPPAMPRSERRPTLQEVYETFKLPEELMSGCYANAILIGHSPAEFFLDFITGFYPTAAVSARVMMAAPQIPRLLETLTSSLQTYQKRYQNPGNSQ